jgi:RNA polymerase sigma-70 factor (ECF subfamily)
VPAATAARRLTSRAALPIAAPPDAEQERALVARARGGDREAFGTLVRGHLPAAIRLAMRVTGNADDAEDVVQDAFLAALRHIDEFEADRRFWPWLSRIVVNRALDLVGGAAHRRSADVPSDLPDVALTALQTAEHRDLLDRVREVMVSMPPRQRLVVQLFDLDGLTVAEIAEMLGSAQATVRWHLHMGRSTLKKALFPLYRGDV